ncbi:hypothetical protein BH10PAT2_BH10PAT2_4300 [soil metagenome]
MKRLAALSALFVLCMVSVVFVTPIFAQTTSPSPIVTPPPIQLDITGTSQSEYTKQLETLQVTYRNQLTTYRNDEKTFQIDKDQYYKIQTLASLEEAVRQTRKVMLIRTDVLLTYLDMSRLTLQNTKGIDTTIKSDALQQIDTLAVDLRLHRKTIEVASDRNSLLSTATQFVPIAQRVNTLSRRVSYVVGYGNLQTVDDKMLTIKKELQEDVEKSETNPLVLAEKKRGLDEVQRNLNDINPPLIKIRAALSPSARQSDLGNLDINKQFSTIYGGLSRSLSYLQELVKN